jgi:hypothetical protein
MINDWLSGAEFSCFMVNLHLLAGSAVWAFAGIGVGTPMKKPAPGQSRVRVACCLAA